MDLVVWNFLTEPFTRLWLHSFLFRLFWFGQNWHFFFSGFLTCFFWSFSLHSHGCLFLLFWLHIHLSEPQGEPGMLVKIVVHLHNFSVLKGIICACLLSYCNIHLLDSQMAVGHRSLLTPLQSSMAEYELSWNRLVSASKLIETSMVWFPFSVHYHVCNPRTFYILHCWSIYVASERRYQLEVLERAWKENIILYLETGGGKTLVAVLLVKSLAHNLRLKGGKLIAVFLVPIVILVHQVRLFATDSVCPINLRLLAHHLEFWLLRCRDHEVWHGVVRFEHTDTHRQRRTAQNSERETEARALNAESWASETVFCASVLLECVEVDEPVVIVALSWTRKILEVCFFSSTGSLTSLVIQFQDLFFRTLRQVKPSLCSRILDACKGVLLANGCCCSGLEMLRNSQKLSFPW